MAIVKAMLRLASYVLFFKIITHLILGEELPTVQWYPIRYVLSFQITIRKGSELRKDVKQGDIYLMVQLSLTLYVMFSPIIIPLALLEETKWLYLLDLLYKLLNIFVLVRWYSFNYLDRVLLVALMAVEVVEFNFVCIS